MNAVGSPLHGGQLGCWLILSVVVSAAAAVASPSRERWPALPEYEIRLATDAAPPAPWRAATLAAVRLPRDGLLDLTLHPVAPVKGPVEVRIFAQGQDGTMASWSPAVPPRIYPDGSIGLHAAPPAVPELQPELTFVVTRPGDLASADALRRPSQSRRLLHLSVVRPRGR